MDRSQRRIVLAIATTFCFWGAIGVLTGALLPDIMEDFGLSATQAGFLISLWSISFVVGSWLSARLVERFRLDVILLTASTVVLLALAVLFRAQSFWLFGPAFGTVGMTMGISVTIGHSLIGIAFPVARTSMLSAVDVIFTLGGVAAPLGVIAISAGGLDWQSLYLLLVAAAIMLIIVQTVALPQVSPKSESSNGGGIRWREIATTPHLALLGLTGLFLGTVEWAQNSWIVSYGLARGMPDNLAQLGFATYLGGMLLTRTLTVFAADWLQKGQRSVYLLSTALIGNLVLLYGSSGMTLLAGNFLIGFGTGAIFPIALGRTMDFDPRMAAVASATLLMGVISGSQIAGIFLGWLADRTGGIDMAFLATTAFFVVLIGLYAMLQRATTAGAERDEHMAAP